MVESHASDLVARVRFSLPAPFEINLWAEKFVSFLYKTLKVLLSQKGGLLGFEKKSFYVPFSNGDYPLKYQYQWNCLRNAAHESYKADFVADCEEYCNKHHIGAISKEIIENCFEMPEMGVQVKHIYYEDVYYPIMNQTCLDCRCEKLGTFCYNNGRVVFVYRNGKTYVAKGYKIIAELEAAGFSKAGLFVPFSNGETIINPALRQRWDSISK